jgi:hypothetical protein
MTADEFEDRVARLEEHIVPPTAEEQLEKAEQLFAEDGNTTRARWALLIAQSIYEREGRRDG